MTTNLEAQFTAKMREVYERARAECQYTATRFLQMVSEHGGLATALMLLSSKTHPEGLTRLWGKGRLDISMEALMLQSPWSSLFSDQELTTARKRLRDLGYVAI